MALLQSQLGLVTKWSGTVGTLVASLLKIGGKSDYPKAACIDRQIRKSHVENPFNYE